MYIYTGLFIMSAFINKFLSLCIIRYLFRGTLKEREEKLYARIHFLINYRNKKRQQDEAENLFPVSGNTREDLSGDRTEFKLKIEGKKYNATSYLRLLIFRIFARPVCYDDCNGIKGVEKYEIPKIFSTIVLLTLESCSQ